MIRSIASVIAIAIAPSLAAAQSVDIAAIVDGHIIAGFETLSQKTEALRITAQDHCDPGDASLEAAYHDAFDAWVRISHLRFGPTELDDRAFALAYWPDSKGFTPKALAALIAAQDPIISDEATFSTVSIAARGFFALEFLLYDQRITGMEPARYRCELVQAITVDIATNTDNILSDWQSTYADFLKSAGTNDTYRTEGEVVQELFKALSTGLQFTSETRIGRPMGTFDRPRPKRAEARRSGRSLRHVVLSLEGTRPLALQLAAGNSAISTFLADAYDRALGLAEQINDPVFTAVAEPQGRIRVEALQQSIDSIRLIVSESLGPTLGVAAGFNSLDGD